MLLVSALGDAEAANGRFLDAGSSIVRAAVLLLAAAQDDSFFTAVSAKNNLEAAGAVGHHRWHLMLPTSARVSPVTYAAVVATRYSELCVKKEHKWCVGTFARGGRDGLPGLFTRCYGFKADPPQLR